MIEKNILVSEEILMSAIINFTGTKHTFEIMSAVTKTGGVINEETLLTALISSWREELLPEILQAITATKGSLTSHALNDAIKSGNKNYVKAISATLAINKTTIPEDYVIKVITHFTGSEPANSVIQYALKSGTVITDATLLAAMKSGWKDEL